jgi:hypothetical protein
MTGVSVVGITYGVLTLMASMDTLLNHIVVPLTHHRFLLLIFLDRWAKRR